MNKVTIIGDEDNNVIIISKNNPLYGSVRVKQERAVIDENGFAKVKQVTALIQGLVTDLTRIGWKAGQEIEGRIYFKEQLKPFNTAEPARDLKVAGETGVICSIDGKPMYRKTFYSPSELTEDVFIRDGAGCILSHTNGDEIREAYASMKAEAAEGGGGEETEQEKEAQADLSKIG